MAPTSPSARLRHRKRAPAPTHGLDRLGDEVPGVALPDDGDLASLKDRLERLVAAAAARGRGRVANDKCHHSDGVDRSGDCNGRLGELGGADGDRPIRFQLEFLLLLRSVFAKFSLETLAMQAEAPSGL